MITHFLNKTKDGGKTSPVDAYFLFEIKGLCSVALLKFNKGGREDFHSHAFNALTWFIKGDLMEEKIDGSLKKYRRAFLPKFTSKTNCHRVVANKDSWCLTVRGSWDKTWYEIDKVKNEKTVFSNHRNIVSKEKI